MARGQTDDAVIAAPFGRVRFRIHAGAVIDVTMMPGRGKLRAPATALGRRVARRLQSYFANGRSPLTIPVAPTGSEFQLRVWRALRRIPAGVPVTYGTLARRLGSSARAVGGACRRNPVPLIVPCHRVVAAGGIGGFMGRRGGAALRIKIWLLEHERRR